MKAIVSTMENQQKHIKIIDILAELPQFIVQSILAQNIPSGFFLTSRQQPLSLSQNTPEQVLLIARNNLDIKAKQHKPIGHNSLDGTLPSSNASQQ